MTPHDTPSLHLEWEQFKRNVSLVAAHLASAGIAWRPHVKSHCSGPIARYLVDRGAVGVTVATLGQAEAMTKAGIGSVLLTTPLGRLADWSRLGDLQDVAEVMVAIDSPAHLAQIEGSRTEQRRVPVVVELDLGLRRTGVRTIEAALDLATAASGSRGAEFRGFMGYEGQIFRAWPPAIKQSAYEEAMAALSSLVGEARLAGIEFGLVTGGGTGSLHLDMSTSPFNESQAGGGIFMDQTYAEDFHVAHLEHALFIDTTVIAVHPPSSLVINAGFKVFGPSRRLPKPISGALQVDAISAHMSVMTGGIGDLGVGSVIRLIPGYSDATTQSFSEILVDGPGLSLPLRADADITLADPPDIAEHRRPA